MASLLADLRSGYRCIFSERMELKNLSTGRAPDALASSAERRRTQGVGCCLIAGKQCGAQSAEARERPVTEKQPPRGPLGRPALWHDSDLPARPLFDCYRDESKRDADMPKSTQRTRCCHRPCIPAVETMLI